MSKRQKPAQKRPDARQISPAELLEEIGSLQRRLTRSLDGWDAGDVDAIRDVAAYTRTLVGFGKGDGVLRRLKSAFQVELPYVGLFKQPDVGGESRLAVGGLIPDDDDVDELGNTYSVSFEDWQTTTVVISASANRRTTSWSQFATDYGNSFGAHVSGTVPRVLEDVQVFRGPNGHMGGYVLRAAGVVAERALLSALADLGRDVPEFSRSFHPDGVSITGFAIGPGPTPWHAFGASASVAGTFQLIGMPIQDRFLTVTWSWDGVTPDGGSLLFAADAHP